MAAIRELLVAAFLLTMGLMVTILACTIIPNHNAYPLLPLMFYAFTPIPALLCLRKSNSGFGSSGPSTMENLGNFMFGVFAASGPAITLVLYHTDYMTLTAMFMCFITAILIGASGYVLGKSMKTSDDAF